MDSREHEATHEDNVPNPIMPKVSPLIRAAPEATSRICSTLCTLVPSLRAWCSQVVLLYRFRMWHMVESAVSSTEAAGTLHTAIPASSQWPNNAYFFSILQQYRSLTFKITVISTCLAQILSF